MTHESSSTDREWWQNVYLEEGEPELFAPEDLFVAEVEGLPVGAALDLGCGPGMNAIWLAELGWQVTGVDWADQAIETARVETAARGLDIRFEVADITKWNSSRQFELVISAYALPPAGEHRQTVLALAAAAVAPGGTLLAVEWDRSLSDEDHWKEHDLISVDELVEGLAGLVVDKAEVVEIDFAKHRAREGSHREEDKFDHDYGHSHGQDDQAKSEWRAAFVRAHRPVDG